MIIKHEITKMNDNIYRLITWVKEKDKDWYIDEIFEGPFRFIYKQSMEIFEPHSKLGIRKVRK